MHALPRRRMDAVQWGRLARRACWVMAVVLVAGVLGVWHVFQVWSRQMEELESARRIIGQLNSEILRQKVLNAYTTGQAVELAAAMQKVVLSGQGPQQVFLAAMVPEALRLQVERGIPASATVAMAVYESGYGKSDLARASNNLFGMKAFASVWQGETVRMPTRDLGRWTVATFRSYPTVGAAVEGYGDFLAQPRYAGAFAHARGREFVAAVLRAGYCPDKDYLGHIIRIMERHHLEELDVVRLPGDGQAEEVAAVEPDRAAGTAAGSMQ